MGYHDPRGNRGTALYQDGVCPVLRQGAARILQPALGRAGGTWEVKKIAAMAEVCNAQMAPRLYVGPVEWAAYVHFGISCPNLLMVGAVDAPFHEALIIGRPKVGNGFVAAPDKPGLWIELNDDIAAAHLHTGDRLHLEMRDAPCDWQNGNSFAGSQAEREHTSGLFVTSPA